MVKELKRVSRLVERRHQAYIDASDERTEVFRRAYEQGMSFYAISKALGGTPSQVRVARIVRRETGSAE